jgi:hypothetical protein
MNKVESRDDTDAAIAALTRLRRYQGSLLGLDLGLQAAVSNARKAGQSEEVLSALDAMRGQVRLLLVEEQRQKMG